MSVLFMFGRSSPEMQDEIPPMVEIAPNHIASEKENSITYSRDYTFSHAVI